MASDVIAAPDVGARVQVGIDAAIVANHQVCVRHLEPDGRARTERFHVPPTLAGPSALSRRLSALPDVTAVAEPTSMTWLPLALALLEAGGQLSLVGSRHAARLRGAIQGKNTSDVIDADVLARAVRCSSSPRCGCRSRGSWRCAGSAPGAARSSSMATAACAG